MTTMPKTKYTVALSLTEVIELRVFLESQINRLRREAIYLDSDVFKRHLRQQADTLQKLFDQLSYTSWANAILTEINK